MQKLLITVIAVVAINFTVFAQDWHTDFEKAKKSAQEKNLNIVLVFEGSDWCAPCIKLNKEIWSTDAFNNLAKNHFVMVKADFPRKKSNKLPEEVQSQNEKLAETYNHQGYFPFVVVLNKNGKVLGETGYEKSSPTAYFNKLTSFEH